jgi:hypothetical protein
MCLTISLLDSQAVALVRPVSARHNLLNIAPLVQITPGRARRLGSRRLFLQNIRIAL